MNVDYAGFMNAMNSPFEMGAKGMQLGEQRYQSNLADQARESELAMQKQYHNDIGQLMMNPQAGAKDYANLIMKYPSQIKPLQESYSMLNADQQKNRVNMGVQVYSALQAGDNKIATDLLRQQSEAYKNAGDEENAKHLDVMAQLVEAHPEMAKATAGISLASAMGPDKFQQTFESLQKTPSEIAKTEAETQKAQFEMANAPEKMALENMYKVSQIKETESRINNDAARLGLDKDKLQSDVQMKLYEFGKKESTLDDGAKKLINDSTVSAVAADQSANKLNNLANDFLNIDSMAGKYAGRWQEGLKAALGSQDAVTSMKQEYVRLRNSEAIKLLPSGAASDNDVKMAMSGMPDENANPEQVSQFLRGMAKMNQFNAVAENAKAEWVNAVGHLGKAKKDIEIDGVKVPSGSTYPEFIKNYADKAVKKREANDFISRVSSQYGGK